MEISVRACDNFGGGKKMLVTYRLPQSVPNFSIRDVISADLILGKFSVNMEHVHKEAWEVVYALKGSVEVLLGDEWIVLRENHCVFIYPGTVHDIVSTTQYSESLVCSFIPVGVYNVLPNQALRCGSAERTIVDQSIMELKTNIQPDRDIVDNYTYAEKRSIREAHQMLCSYLVQFSIRLMREYKQNDKDEVFYKSQRGKDYDYIVNQINKYIEKHATDPLTVQAIAEHFHYSRSRLYKIFKAATGEDLNTVIKRKQLTEAQKLLLAGELPVRKIAGCVGFNSESYFSLWFKKMTGKTPTVFRNRKMEG